MTFIKSIFDHNTSALEQALNLYHKRNNAITSNIANIETPQYRAVELDFKSELESAFEPEVSHSPLKVTNGKHLDLATEGEARFIPDYSGMTKADGNNVDLDIQMGKLSYNSGKYSAAATIVRKKMQMLRFAIQQAMR
ncbi:MAG: flagellar basal body rod protein FlgB [Bdellovibrionales bacterium]|nr:flagellar basal body rod protein FlgB [Bdellovibrionales bacterium]